MEPSPKTFEEMGRLCTAWSYLEAVTEHTLWGVLQADKRWGEIVSARLDLQGFWKLILEHATQLDPADVAELRAINKSIVTVTRHRNIIVHGRIHAVMEARGKRQTYDPVGPAGADYDFTRIPCWTIFKGVDAGKKFPVSTAAVESVRINIQSISERVIKFNKLFGHFKGREPDDSPVVTDWPAPPLE